MMADKNVSKKLCTEAEIVNKKYDESFTPREYQIEILEAARKQNTIACLGTGTGKTFIAVMLIRESANAVRQPFEQKGKRIFFLVPTVPLVHQQTDTIKKHTDLKVKGYSGDMDVDSWNNDKWTKEFINFEVLVMTAEIFRIIVDHRFIPLNKIELLIFDECHRAQGDHPYRQAMKCFTDMNESEMPKIFGLSASLLNGKCKPTQLEKHLLSLERTLNSTIITASDVIDLQKYGADPDEYAIYYKSYSIETELTSQIDEKIKLMKSIQKNVGRNSEDMMEFDLIFFDKPSRCLNSLKITLTNLGPWCALKAAEVFSEELDTILVKGADVLTVKENYDVLADLKVFILYFIEECKKLAFKSEKNNIISWPHKLQRLLQIFLAIKKSKKFAKQHIVTDKIDYNEKDPKEYYYRRKYEDLQNYDNQICSIVFVEQRITAYVLKEWIIEIKKEFPELEFLKPEFIVGHGTFGLKRTSMSEKNQKKALTDFRERKCNVLISTNVLEEGMDVQQCNAVIRFDLPIDFRAYVQSKGRARAKDSIYVLMIEYSEKCIKFLDDMCNFKTIEQLLLSKCHNRALPTNAEVQEHMTDTEIPPYMPYGKDGPRITSQSAISVINRYCAHLPCDMATTLTARWFIKEVDHDGPKKSYVCELKMPINSALRKLIVSDKMKNRKLAKMSAALKACQELNKIGELNEHLVPRSNLVQKALEEELGPIEEEDGDGAIPGTNRRRQVYDKHVPVFLQNSQPWPMCPSFLHILDMTLVEPIPQILNPRNRPIIDPSNSSRGLAILLSKKLPKVNSFPIFTKSGKIVVDILLSDEPVILSGDQIKKIENFHNFIFTDALYLHKNKTFSPENAEMPFYIIPVNKDYNVSYTIDWAFMNEIENHPYNNIKLNTFEKINRMQVNENNFKDAVLMRSYKIDTWAYDPTFHHVIKILYDKSPKSILDDGKLCTFKQYYKEKYNIDIIDDNQPLIETFQNPRLHAWKPIYTSAKEAYEDVSPSSKTKKRRLQYREYLIPELSVFHPFPSSFFHKVQTLPTILFRLRGLLLAEEIRQNVAKHGFIGSLESNNKWPYFNLESSDKELKKFLSTKGVKIHCLKNGIVPQDIVKNGNNIKSFERKLNLSNHPGPNPSLILQSLTTKSAGDEFDLERLEMIGDSFLKYAMSVKIFIKHPNFDEGKLTKMRIGLIQNLHLYQRAKKKKLPEFLQHTTFSCNSTWLPPCYTIGEEKIPKILNKKSKSEQSEEVKNAVYHFFKKQVISDKCIADSVEALIGTYLLSCGQKGALMFMSWLGLRTLPFVNDENVSKADFEKWPPEPPSPIINELPNWQWHLSNLTGGFDRFERHIKYTFKNKALLLQALTHPSYSYNEITDCYQRLEFLGDAVLDFLITRQLYEDPNDHSPGKLTDLRSALVNNIYFASLAVQHDYHKYLKMLSPSLLGLMKHYIEMLENSEAFHFFKEHGYYLEEIECFDLEEVEVPKALGDIFESVAGAIYIDSGMSLDAVWAVCYPMIKPAMDHLSQYVPKSPVRELYEEYKKKDIFTIIHYPGQESYIAEVTLPSGRKIGGKGPNKKVAKRSCAKRALAEIRKSTMVVD